MDETEAAATLGALSHPMRLRIFRALVVAGPEGLTPGVIGEALGLANATLSFHLKELAQAGLVSQERASRHLIYRASFERMGSLLGFLTDNCCAGAPCSASLPGAAACAPSPSPSSSSSCKD